MEFWELEDHEVAYSWLRAFEIMPGGPGMEVWELEDHEVAYSWLAPGIQNVAWEWSSGSSKTTKWPTVGPGHSE
eukprot:1200860-Pyramimonas_sp.AAC.1